MAPGSIVPIIIAAHAAAVRRVLEAFRVAGATAPDRARPPDALGIKRDGTFAELEKAGVLRAGHAPGTYYLDEVAHAARYSMRTRRKKIVLLILLLLVLVGLAAIMFIRPTMI